MFQVPQVLRSSDGALLPLMHGLRQQYVPAHRGIWNTDVMYDNCASWYM